MYAVIATGGKQYRVSAGDVIRVEKLDAEAGSTVTFDQVLMLGDGAESRIGQPYLEGETVSAKVRAHVRGDRIEIIKFKRRKHHQKHMGHRQDYTEIEITAVAGQGPSDKSTPKKKTAKKAPVKAAAKTAKKKKTAKKAAKKKTPARKAAAKKGKKTAKKKATKKAAKKATRKH